MTNTDAATPNVDEALLPCPFCGAGDTQFQQENYWAGQSSKVLSVTIRHWCAIKPGELSIVFGIKAKTREDAIAKWNTRSQQDALPRWIACSERMPVSGCDVLVAWRNDDYGAHPLEPEWEIDRDTFDGDDFGICHEVTHWQPLPKPPGETP